MFSSVLFNRERHRLILRRFVVCSEGAVTIFFFLTYDLWTNLICKGRVGYGIFNEDWRIGFACKIP